MGVEHYLVCEKCKQYIDCHKCYMTVMICDNPSPIIDGEQTIIEGYWGGRALWFLWQHKSHGKYVKWYRDTNDNWWDLMHQLEEVHIHGEQKKETLK